MHNPAVEYNMAEFSKRSLAVHTRERLSRGWYYKYNSAINYISDGGQSC